MRGELRSIFSATPCLIASGTSPSASWNESASDWARLDLDLGDALDRARAAVLHDLDAGRLREGGVDVVAHRVAPLAAPGHHDDLLGLRECIARPCERRDQRRRERRAAGLQPLSPLACLPPLRSWTRTASRCMLRRAVTTTVNRISNRAMRNAKRPLSLADLAALAERFAVEPQPALLYAAVDALVQDVVGHRLFTLMRVHEATDEVERIYSSNTAAYPVGGRKVKRGTPWSGAVLDRGEVFVARTPDEVREAFADHALIESLGIGSIMNIPIAWAGRRLGTMNISHEAGWFTAQDDEPRAA